MTLEHHERRLDDLGGRIDRLAARVGALEDRQAAPPAPTEEDAGGDDLGIALNLAGVQHRLKALLHHSEDRWAQDCDLGNEGLGAHVHSLREGIAAILRDSGCPL